jgi:hypothetical protein
MVLTNQWQFQETGIGWNSHRRAHVIYDLKDPSLEVPFTALVVAREANLRLIERDDRLHPLDRDHEWNGYHARFPLVIGGAPDFCPRLHRFCSLSHEEARRRVDELIDRIQGRPEEEGRSRVRNLAERMARAFRDMYQRVIDELKALIQAGQAPPGARAEINQLEQKINTLNQFIATQGGSS